MKKLFLNTYALDDRAIQKYSLSNEILMENAAISIVNLIRKKHKKGAKILGVCGSGNNTADVITAARMLNGDYKVRLFLTNENLKPFTLFKLNLAKKTGVKITKKLTKADCIIDGIFGSGLNRTLDSSHIKIIKKLNKIKAHKIACDVPSGLGQNGEILGACFKADDTICMGVAKVCCFLDLAKDYVGKVRVAKLGISHKKFQTKPDAFLLQKSDLKLPLRDKKCANKGDFGHTFIISGELSGASNLAAKAAYAIGSGLVSIIGDKAPSKDYIMQTKQITAKMNAGALGMGLSSRDIDALDIETLKTKALVLDASMLRSEVVKRFLNIKNSIITPHPSEFCSLLKIANLADISTDELQKNRYFYAKLWSQNIKGVLILKGASTIIAKNGKIFIMPFGNASLAKGGSGDVLSGLCAGLLAQGYSPLKAAKTAVLAHALAVKKHKNSYWLTPNDIIKGIKWLQKK